MCFSPRKLLVSSLATERIASDRGCDGCGALNLRFTVQDSYHESGDPFGEGTPIEITPFPFQIYILDVDWVGTPSLKVRNFGFLLSDLLEQLLMKDNL